MSDVTAEYVDKFWELIDEVLNALLFVLIDLELLVIHTYQKILFYSCYRTDNKANHKIYFDLHTLNSSAIERKIRKRYLF
jgi:hypothetical protein